MKKKKKWKGMNEGNKAITIKKLHRQCENKATTIKKLRREYKKYQDRGQELEKALAKAETENKSLNKELHDAAVHLDEVFEVFADLEASKTRLTQIQRKRNDAIIKNLRTENERLQVECKNYQARARELSEKLKEHDEALASEGTSDG